VRLISAVFSHTQQKHSTTREAQKGVKSESFGQKKNPMDSWAFLHAAPPHLLARRLGATEHPITIDGKLDDPAWVAAQWTSPIVDITDHMNASNVVPDYMQMRGKVRWDAHYLYVGVEVREPFISANVTGHNTPDGPPYKDNDVELFVDVSGTTQFYKEFEMSARNATYDVLWGVPDLQGLNCSNAPGGIVPVCVNTSAPFYAGNWSMVAATGGSGMRTATHFDASDYEQFVSPFAIWTAEIAMPISRAPTTPNADGAHAWHGVLLDSDPHRPDAFAAHDPATNAQTYWYFDLSRAEHPRKYSSRGSGGGTPEERWCPLGCNAALANWSASLSALSSHECAMVKSEWPTLLGTDPWSCYWEWTLASVGANAYMHRPLWWASLELGEASSSRECRPIEWPGRYLARSVFVSQARLKQSTGKYSTSHDDLVSACSALGEPACRAADLRRALQDLTDIFTLNVTVQANASVLTKDCTSRPCYTATWHVRAPVGLEGGADPSRGHGGEGGRRATTEADQRSSRYNYSVAIDSNGRLDTLHSRAGGDRPCL
jgi:hypothetical protein